MAARQTTEQSNLFQCIGPHGNDNPLYIGAYKRGCRCEDCVETYTVYRQRYHEKRLARDPDYREKCRAARRVSAKRARAIKTALSAEPVHVEHASPAWTVGHSGYVKGCRCDGCRKGNREYGRDHRANSRLSPEGRLVVLNASRRKWSRIKNDADRKRRLCGNAKARRVRLRGWLSDLKMTAGCVDCGFKGHHAALDFDHVRGKKLFTIGPNLTVSRERLLAEIAKCEIRCSNCHRVRSYERRQATTAARP